MIANTNHLFVRFCDASSFEFLPSGLVCLWGWVYMKKTKSGPSFTFLFKKFSMNSLKLLNLFQNSNMMMYCYIFCNVLVLQSFKIEQQRPKILLFQIKNNYQNRDMTLPTYGTKSNQHYVSNDNAYHLKTGTNANFKFLTIY